MVRTYKCRKAKGYTEQQLLAAIEAVKEQKVKVTLAARKYNVPATTLYDHTKGKLYKIGAGTPTVLTAGEEKEITVTLQVLQEIGFSLTKEIVTVVIRDYLKDQLYRPNPFRDGIPGKDWWNSFLKRWHKELSVRKPQALSTHRAVSATPEVMDAWFERVSKLYSETGLSELPIEELNKRIWNCDETGFCTSAAVSRVLARRGAKDVQDTLGGSGREYITVLGCGSASGVRLAPYVVYKGKNIWSRWTQGGPASCLYSVSDSGWMEADNFRQWFEKMFIPAVKHLTKDLPVVLFFDGHHSHISLALIELARANNVHLICFPPHCTHILQPLDVSVFSPLKSSWKKILKDHQIASCAAAVTKEDFPRLLAKLWDISFLPQHFKSGFTKCGLCPLARSAIPPEKLIKSAPHEKPLSPEPQPQRQQDSENSVIVTLSGECTVNNTVTPIRLHLRGYFTKVLQKNKQTRSRPVDKRKVRPQFYGEALTVDEVFSRMEEEEKEKKAAADEKKRLAEEKKKAAGERKRAAEEKKRAAAERKRITEEKKRKGMIRRKCSAKSKKKTKTPSPPSSSEHTTDEEAESAESDDGMCEECEVRYAEDDEEMKESWMGCDSCTRWFHCHCVGLSEIPTGFWSCQNCS